MFFWLPVDFLGCRLFCLARLTPNFETAIFLVTNVWRDPFFLFEFCFSYVRGSKLGLELRRAGLNVPSWLGQGRRLVDPVAIRKLDYRKRHLNWVL